MDGVFDAIVVAGVILGCIIGVPLGVIAGTLVLPLALICILSSAIWAGEVRAFPFIERRSVARHKPGAGHDLADEGGEGEKDEKARAGRRRPTELGSRSHPDREVAIRSYYFGPIVDDMLDASRAMWSIGKEIRESAEEWLGNVAESDIAIYKVVVTVTLKFGVSAGLVLGVIATAILGLIYVLVGAASLVVAMLLAGLLRLTDEGICVIQQIGRTCWTCGESVSPIPHYLCRGCKARHRNILPGPYGVLRRECRCGLRFPTMFTGVSANLQAVCPRTECGADLPPRFGSDPEIVIPLFGAPNVGKTRLMYMMVQALKDWVYDQRGKVSYVGDAAERLDMIGDSLRESSHTDKTAPGPARAFGLHINFSGNNRLVYFFDAAGEMYTSHERLPELRYLDKARTYVFVADPLAAKGVWAQLSAADQERLRRFRTDSREVDKSYQATLGHLLKVAQHHKRRGPQGGLAFAVSKLDLLEAAGVDLSATVEATETWVRREDGLNLGDVSRGARHSFDEVRYFCTAALKEEDGRADESVRRLLFWVLDRAGIRIDGATSGFAGSGIRPNQDAR